MMLNDLLERIELPDGRMVQLSGQARAGGSAKLEAMEYLSEFRLEARMPSWRYESGRITIEKTLVLPHEQNTAFIHYSLLEGEDGVQLLLRPSTHFRPHETPVSVELDRPKR